MNQSGKLLLAAAAVLLLAGACAPVTVRPVESYVDPATQEMYCVQSYGDPRGDRFTVVVSNEAGNYQAILVRTFLRANQNRFNALGAEQGIPVVLQHGDGTVWELTGRGQGNNQSSSVSSDSITIALDEGMMRRLLASQEPVQVTYSGRNGSESFPIPPVAWAALNEGFGRECLP